MNAAAERKKTHKLIKTVCTHQLLTNNLPLYNKAGIASFLSIAVSNNTRNGPFGLTNKQKNKKNKNNNQQFSFL